MSALLTPRVDAAPAAEVADAIPAPRIPGDSAPRGAWWGHAIAVAAATAGLLSLAFVGFLAVLSPVQYDRAQRTQFATFRGELARAVAPVQAPIPTGTPVALLRVPRLGIDNAVVLEGATSRVTMRGPAHRSDTALPGQAGVAVIEGRARTFGGVFARLGSLRPGDTITAVTGGGEATYTVDTVRRSSDPAQALPPTRSRLTLVTADGGWTPASLVVVSAALTAGDVQTASSAVGSDQQPLGGDAAAALPLLLWAQLLLVLRLTVVWARRRVAAPVLWIGAAAAFVAITWNIFENLAALLPATL
ncbi:MAG: sortase [Frankiaceae bacterium]|jgi:sortase A|nr:sortase [Frankiaceae bacterium]